MTQLPKHCYMMSLMNNKQNYPQCGSSFQTRASRKCGNSFPGLVAGKLLWTFPADLRTSHCIVNFRY